MVSLSLFFWSCGDDDPGKDPEIPETSVLEELLIGKWDLAKMETYYDNGEIFVNSYDEVVDYDQLEYEVIVFNEDGTCRNYSCYSKDLDYWKECGYDGQGRIFDWDDKGKWEFLDQDRLVLLFYGEGRQEVRLLELTDEILSFECYVEDEDGDEAYNCNYRMTYRKSNIPPVPEWEDVW